MTKSVVVMVTVWSSSGFEPTGGLSPGFVPGLVPLLPPLTLQIPEPTVEPIPSQLTVPEEAVKRHRISAELEGRLALETHEQRSQL